MEQFIGEREGPDWRPLKYLPFFELLENMGEALPQVTLIVIFMIRSWALFVGQTLIARTTFR